MKLSVEYVPITAIKPYKGNAKLHPKEQVEQICRSITDYGMNDPIAVWKDNEIIEGHGRYLACLKLGVDEVPIIRLDGLTDAQRREYMLVHNKTTMNSGFDLDVLNVELSALPEFDAPFYDFAFAEEAEPAEVVEDEPPEAPTEAKTKLGDIYKLGDHRLICGDSTDISTIKRLLGGAVVDMVFTDPPYNVAFNGRSGKFDVIKNDDLTDDDFNDLIQASCNIIRILEPKAYYIWCNWKFYGILQEQLEYKSCIVWAKNVFGMGKGYRHQHEFCLFNGSIDDGINNESDLWEVAKDKNYVHPTQKPVALCARALKNHKNAATIVDLFGGSGSTLIACEQLNRKCYMVELDPKYCDVIVERWEKFTGQKAELIT
jgi:site-specific DNA-methyltransferase (adenine-specific)